jgi:hypothetical protein
MFKGCSKHKLGPFLGAQRYIKRADVCQAPDVRDCHARVTRGFESILGEPERTL